MFLLGLASDNSDGSLVSHDFLYLDNIVIFEFIVSHFFISFLNSRVFSSDDALRRLVFIFCEELMTNFFISTRNKFLVFRIFSA